MSTNCAWCGRAISDHATKPCNTVKGNVNEHMKISKRQAIIATIVNTDSQLTRLLLHSILGDEDVVRWSLENEGIEFISLTELYNGLQLLSKSILWLDDQING